MSTKEGTTSIATPTKKETRRKSCHFESCPCYDFHPETASTSAVNSDEQTTTLISWLSGNSMPKIDEKRVTTSSHICPNRLHASIAILNAIRDACRPFLEASAPSPDVNASSFYMNGKQAHPNFNEKTAYEDSFPSLPLISSALPPKLLVGRKKNKSLKIASPAKSDNKIPSKSWNATNAESTQIQEDVHATKESNICQTSVVGNLPAVSASSAVSCLHVDPDSTRTPPKPRNYCSTDEIETDSENNQQKLERLVLIYVSILRSQLAPSLLMEFHLLLRLLTLSDTNRSRKMMDKKEAETFDKIFQCERSCRDFAAKALTDLESMIVNLGHETIKMMVAFPAIQKHCRGLCLTMQDIIYAGKSTLIFDTDRKALGHNTNAAHLTLPFDHARDSRHNYRSAQMNLIFREREELRDSFLFQLRTFQDIRGRLMGQAQIEKSIVSLQFASKQILSSVSPGNKLWFVNFVCDLLLQTGLAPVSETDSEVLRQIGDKKRLQKLHTRFTSTSVQTSKSSKKLRIDQRGSPSHPLTTPEQSFSGHQEFFSIFIRAGDSHDFNTHFRHRLAHLIRDMTAVNETKIVFNNIAKTQMLAKFLGMLDFSPNWNLPDDSISDRGCDMISPPINVMKCIEEAWTHRRLVVVIPWVTQYLAMMKWDAISRKLQYYINTFALLRRIKHQCLPYQIDSYSIYQTNMMKVVLQLESIFRDVVGLSTSQRLPMVNLPTLKSVESDATGLIPLDDIPLCFSQHSSSSLIPQLKDLCDLLKDLTPNNEKLANIVPKKVRPDIIRNVGSTESSFISRIVESGQMSPWSIKCSRTPNKSFSIKDRLVDSFFHQHKSLQELCEIVVDRAIKNFANTASSACILPMFKNEAASFDDYFNRSHRMILEEYKKLLDMVESNAEVAATALMRDHFDRTITGTLHLLAPPETQSKVVEVATSLTISHALQQGRIIIHSIVHQEKKKFTEEFIRKEKKLMAGVPLNSLKRDLAVERETVQSFSSFHSLAALTASLRLLQTTEADESVGVDGLKEEAEIALQHLRQYFIGAGISPAVLEFEMCLLSIVKNFFANPLHHRLLRAVIEVADVLSFLGKLGYAESSKHELESLLCDFDNMSALIESLNYGINGEPNPITYESIGNFLFVLLEGSIISCGKLEEVLLRTVMVKCEAKMVSHVILNKLVFSRTGLIDPSDGLVIMVRLQRVLSDVRVGC